MDQGIVKIANIEEPGGMNYTISGPETMLKALDGLKES